MVINKKVSLKFILFPDSQNIAQNLLGNLIKNELSVINVENEIYDLILLALFQESIILRERTFSFWARILSNEISQEINF